MLIRHFELVEIAREFLKEYDMDLEIPIKFNPRSKRTLGSYNFKRDSNNQIVPISIELSQRMIISSTREQVIDVLKHELVHYAFSMLGKKFSDGDREFEDELKRRSVSSTRFYKGSGYAHIYQCNICGEKYKRFNKLPSSTLCNCSIHSRLVYLGTEDDIKEEIKNVGFKAGDN